MSTRKPDREKYLQIMREQGLHKAISALHAEMRDLEFESFEGRKGYQPELWESIKKFREFSQELWELDPTRVPK